jgi:HTH-type transcriptional regulator, competence development regulator
MTVNETTPVVAEKTDKTFGQTVRDLRKAKGIGLREFARRASISPSFLTQIEKGGCAVPEERVVAFARVLEQDVDEFLALAGRVASDLDDFIRERPRAVATFLRTVRESGISDQYLQTLTQLVRQQEPKA